MVEVSPDNQKGGANDNDGSGCSRINTNNYNSVNGKIKASVSWLVTRIYAESSIPDNLIEPFHTNDQRHLELSAPLIACLTNGSFYCQAAARIFHDNSLLTGSNNIGAVFQALSQIGIDVRDLEGNCITEESLFTLDPARLNISAHLHLIDALMTAHLRTAISIEKIVQAISNYTSVEKREEPLDCVDALLFWINKICLLVRDDVEQNGLPGVSELPTIPEMEDLYEDLCDGTCICAVLSFYRPTEVPLHGICFNDPMSVRDCRFNLEILSNFCASHLPWNPFHFAIEDILYLHESLQPNVNAFLAELFLFFEGHSVAIPPGKKPKLHSPFAHSEPNPPPAFQQRRFIPVQGIPDLRGQESSSKMAKTLNNKVSNNKRDSAFSITSADSFATDATLRSKDSLMMPVSRPSKLGTSAQVTHFGAFSGQQPYHQQESLQQHQNAATNPNRNMAGIRLQMEELRRQLAQRQQFESAKQEQRRNEASKDAFFRVMSKSVNSELLSPGQQQSSSSGGGVVLTRSQDNSALDAQLQQMTNQFAAQMNMGPPQDQFLPNRPISQYHAEQQPYGRQNTGISQHMNSTPRMHPLQQQQQMPMFSPIPNPQFGEQPQYNPPPMFTSPNSAPNPMHDQQQQYFSQQQLQQESSHYAVPGQQPSHMGSIPAPPNYNTPAWGYATMPPQVSTSQLHLMDQQHQRQFQQQQPYHSHVQQQYYQQPQNTFAPPMGQQQFMSAPLNTTTVFPSSETLIIPQHQSQLAMDAQFYGSQFPSAEEATFRLHHSNAPASRLDPQLDLSRDMTNWGKMTCPQRKTWATNNKSPDGAATMGAKIPATTTAFQLEGGVGTTTPHLVSGEANGRRSGMQSSEQEKTLLLDQTSYVVGGSNSCAPHIATPNGGSALNLSGSVLVDDITDPDTEMTPEMQAKRRALLANQIRRKERIVAKSEEKELEEMDRQQTKMLRMEQAELRKMEREQRRQKLLEEYKRKKLEQELGEPSTGRMGGCTSSTISLNRGQSQPPFGRPKSQSNMNLAAVSGATTKRLGRAQSSVTGNNNDGNATPRPVVPSTAEPTLKLYARHTPKSNRSLITNALQYSIFPGHVSTDQRTKAQIALGQSDSKHFLVLFRDHRLQYRGLYTWDQFSDTVHKIEGQGPKICKESMMSIMFKYDSGAKSFGQIQTKHLSATIDGFVIADQYWQKPKIPHSSR